MMKELICRAESTRPPKVSISKTRKSAPCFKARFVSRRTKVTMPGSISPRIMMIQASPVVWVSWARRLEGKARRHNNRRKGMFLYKRFMLSVYTFWAFYDTMRALKGNHSYYNGVV
jgi:hypothetical protein